jgi:hypothetical protein
MSLREVHGHCEVRSLCEGVFAFVKCFPADEYFVTALHLATPPYFAMAPHLAIAPYFAIARTSRLQRTSPRAAS